MIAHCTDNSADRSIGEFWERQFCKMAFEYGKCFTAHQWNTTGAAVAFHKNNRLNKYTLPDITIWSAPGEHHEIKHKNATKFGSYGLEQYRFEALLDFAIITKQSVFYTIHDHDLSGGRENRVNDGAHWFTAEVGSDLNYAVCKEFPGYSWINGEKKEVNILYWSKHIFESLISYWERGKSQSALFNE